MVRTIRWSVGLAASLLLVVTAGCGPGFGGSPNSGGGGGGGGVVTGPVPFISTVAPQPFAGPVSGGTVLTFNGANLLGATVTVGSTPCGSVNVNPTGTVVTCVAPAGTAGNASVILRTQRGSAAESFLYQNAPTVATVFPLPFAGPTTGSTLITLGGSNLQNATVTLGGTPCTSTSVNGSGTSLSCVTPARPAGLATVQVTTPGGSVAAGTAFRYQAAPTVTATLPTPFSGPTAGGTGVTLTGTNLDNTTQVTFGGVACTGLAVNGGGTAVTCTTPARPAGPAAVVLRTPGGQTTVGSVFLYEGAPTVTAVSPRGGPVAGGTTITVTGTSFFSTTAVTVGGAACGTVTVLSQTSLTCVAPAGSAGPANVAVTNGTGTGTLAGGFTYEGAPTIASVSPTFGPLAGGTAITVNGSGLLSLTGITVGGAACTGVTPVSTSTATCTTPARSGGPADVAVTNATGSATLPGGFFYEGSPTVTAVTPSAGGTAGGTTLTITGTSFQTATAIRVGGTDCTSFSIQSSTQATCVTPPRPAGTVGVQVVNATGNFTLGGAFTYESAPTLSLVSPSNGPTAGNTLITLTGSQLRTVTAVTVGGVVCGDLTPVSPTSVTCRTPARPAGLATITATNATGTANFTNAFRYESAPSITSISPSVGPIGGGTTITINGLMFSTATGVTVGGNPCTSFTPVSPTQVTCVTPASAAGPATVVLTNATGDATVPNGFTYEGAPTLTSVSPSAGTVVGGTVVTLFGTNLRTVTNVDIGGASCAPIVPTSSTQISCTTAPRAAGTVSVDIVNPTGPASLAAAYTYEDVPTVTSATPNVGPTIGGTAITVVGTGFLTTSVVRVDGNPCTNLSIGSATSLTCNTPPGTAGPKDVVVTNASGDGTRTNGFTYVGPPTVTGISPSAGPIAGNTLVTLTGTNLQIATGATFGGVACTSFTVVNATSATCRTPAASAGPADVILTSGSGSAAAPSPFVYEGAPTISGVTPIVPAAGTTSGNTLVTINGTGFLTASGVTIGGNACTTLSVFSATQLTCRTPARPAGPADVVVTNATASATATGAYTYEVGPTVSAVSPAVGSVVGGTTITLTGTSLLSLTAVTLGGSSCTNVTVLSATQATCVTPARAAGSVTVTVVNAAGSGNLPNGFTYEGAPTITSVSPVAGGTGGGTTISIVGTNLGTTTGVTVGGNTCTSLTIVTPTNVTCSTPPGAAGTVAVVVTNGSGIATLGAGFTYESAPTVTAVSPTFGPTAGGNTITLTGTRFLSTTGITVGGVACTSFAVTNATTATCVVPAGAAGTATVAVTNGGGTGSLPAAYTYVGAPTVSAVSPSAGSTNGNQTITLTGTNFQTVTAVTVGGGNCSSITVLSATTLTCVTPVGSNGAVTVTAINGSGPGSLANAFTYESAPTLTLVSPASGPPTGMTLITLTGQRFLSTTGVTVGGNPCTGLTIVNATTITCNTPAGAPGPQPVAVTNATGTASLPSGFVYDNAPTISGVSPSAGTTAGGTTITLTGTGFSSVSGVTVGGAACTSLTPLGPTQVSCVTPARPAGPATVAVTNAAGTGSLTNGYTYEGAPTIATVSPAAGTTAGNTLITITGTNFLSASSVTVGGLNCTSLAVASATSLSCRTPANVAGSFDVVVTNGNSSATRVNGYTYEGVPTISSVSPGAGTTAGNTLVTITGTGFLSATNVTFGGVACTSITVVSATSITCRTPARPAGASTVAVTNPAGTGNLPAAYVYEGNPTISSISPNSGSQGGGTLVTVTGTNLLSAVSVTIAGNPCGSLTVLSATQVTCVTPSGAPGAANVVITNGSNSATLTNGFNYEGAPTLTAVSPPAGPVAGNTLITLTGTSFRSTTGVTVGGAACTSLVVVSPTSVQCRTPAAVAGTVAVAITNGFATATLPASFTYEDAPTITAITPSAGRLTAGPAVTITGTGLFTTTSVTIGGAACTGFSGVSTTSLTCTKPAGTAGPADVVVTNPSGSATSVGGFVYEANPTIATVSPSAGPIAGGTTITLTGTGFLSATSVDISGTACGSLTVVDATTVTCVTGARAAGLANVRIFNANGNVTLNNSFRYEGSPTLTTIAPTSGTTAGGQLLTLTGTNLLTLTGVTVGGVACTALTPVSTTSATCLTPARPAGPASVVATNPTGIATLTNAFTYEGAPTLTVISPNAGTTAGNTLVTLTGTNFLSVSGVTINGLPCTSLAIASATSLNCRTPANVAGAYDVVVTNATSTATLTNGFTYEVAPTVTGISPNAGTINGNTLVTITGTNFLSATSVNLSGTACTSIAILSATQLQCRTGARTAGTVNVSVVNPVATGTLTNGYVYEGNPTITSIVPSSGSTAGGTAVTINGTNFRTVTAVNMSGTTCGTLNVVSPTQLTCVTGARGAGATNVVVTNATGTATVTNGFTYEGNPTVTAVSPAAGRLSGGTIITLTGTSFLSTTGITVGGSPCAPFTVISNTTATCSTPPGAEGAFDVVLTNATGSGTRTNGYTYEGTPTVSLIAPVVGPTAGGTTVNFTGTNFLSVTGITFGGTACTNIVITNGTSMSCRTPLRPVGAVTVAITNPNGTLNVPNAFTFEDAPTLTAISPASGPATGGQTVTLTGTRFLSVTSVTIGGAVCTALNIVSATSLTCTTPLRPAGPATVVVTNSAGSVTRVNFYTYDNAPTLTSVTPAAGRIAGGRSVTLTGTNFTSATGATFGGVACTAFTVTSATTATCTTPAASAGAVDVVITNSVASATLLGGYTYEAVPTVTSITPNAGPLTGGQTVTITGTGFLSATGASLVGTTCTNVNVIDATTLTCRSGARTAATGAVAVTNDAGTGSLANGYTYRAAPTVTAVSPNMGPIAGGTSVVITGTNFLNGALIRLGNVACSSITWTSATSLTCVSGATATMARGDVVVTNPDNQAGTLPASWLYVGNNAWLATTTTGAPLGRSGHSAVWTGSRMLVWGGLDDSLIATNTGGIYDPVADSWSAMSTGANVPSARTNHQAVIVGTRMVVFGGSDGSTELGDGARYEIGTDSWATMTATGAPSARESFTAVSSGTQMIVWGGEAGGTPTASGGRYDPAADTWAATDVAGAPAARSLHTAVWSGTQMIVWGGFDGGGTALSTGSRYTPGTDTWSATGGVPPAARGMHTAVWSSANSRMVVWGGSTGATYLNTGGQYDPVGNAWTATTTTGAPTARAFHSVVFTGTRMAVWGGESIVPALLNTGGSYNPVGNTWAAISTTGAPSARALHSAVWATNGTTGTMILFGGRTGSANGVNDGGMLNPP